MYSYIIKPQLNRKLFISFTLMGFLLSCTGGAKTEQEDSEPTSDETEEVDTGGWTITATEKWNLVSFAVGTLTDGLESPDSFALADVHLLADGSYRMYYTGRSGSGNHVWVAHSPDAIEWQPHEDRALMGSNDITSPYFECGGQTIHPLANNDIRMFIRCTKQYPSDGQPDYAIYSALSSDGIHFTHEQVRIDNSNHDPTSIWQRVGHGRVYRLEDGRLAGIFSVNAKEADPLDPTDLALFTSQNDGESWTYEKTLYKGWHDPIVFKHQGKYIMYAYYLLEYPAKVVSEDGLNWPTEITEVKLYDTEGLSDDGGIDGLLPNDDPHADLAAIVKADGSLLLYTNFNGSIGVYEPKD